MIFSKIKGAHSDQVDLHICGDMQSTYDGVHSKIDLTKAFVKIKVTIYTK